MSVAVSTRCRPTIAPILCCSHNRLTVRADTPIVAAAAVVVYMVVTPIGLQLSKRGGFTDRR